MTRTSVTALFTLAFLLLAAQISAQSRRPAPRRSSASEQSFSLGLAPLSLITRSGKINLRGEWAYAGNKSLALTVAVPRPTKAPNWLTNDIEVPEAGSATKNTFQNFGLILENRFYLGHSAPAGLYVGPYARYNRFWLTRSTENPNNNAETRITGAVGGFGLGGMVGAQFHLGEKFTLDVTFAGLDFKWMRGTLRYSTNDPDNNIAEFRDKVQTVVEDIPLIGSKLSADIEGNEVKVRTPGLLLPGYRFNLTVNYVF